MKVTLVVPVRNEARTIKECAQSIMNQTYKGFEVIFVDGGSTDGTYEFLDRIRRDGQRVKVLSEPGIGPGFGKSLGFKAGKGELLAHIDGDNIVPCDYLELCVKKLKDSSVAGVRPGLRFEYEDNLLGKALRLRRRLLFGDEPFASEYPTIYRRTVYDRAGGIDPRLIIGEDYDLWVRLQKAAEELNQSFVVEKSAVVRNRPKEGRINEIFWHSVWYGSGIISLLTRHPEVGSRFIAEPIFYPITICLLIAYIFHPTLVFLLLPLVFVLRWGVFFAKRRNRIRSWRELVLAMFMIPLIRVVESLGSFVGLVKSLASRPKYSQR